MTLKETGNPIESVAEDVRNSARQAEAAAAAEGIEPNGRWAASLARSSGRF